MVISRQRDSRRFLLSCVFLCCLFCLTTNMYPPPFYFEKFTAAGKRGTPVAPLRPRGRPPAAGFGRLCSLLVCACARCSEPPEGAPETPQHVTPKHSGTFLPGKRTFFYGTTTPSSHLRSLLWNITSQHAVRSQPSPAAPRTTLRAASLPHAGLSHGPRSFILAL